MVGRVSHCPAPSELALPSISRGSAHLVRRRMNAHRDPPFTYKLVAITADNAHEAQPFTGAELVLLDGIVGVEIGPCDVLIMDGSRYHGVAPLRSLPGTLILSRNRCSIPSSISRGACTWRHHWVSAVGVREATGQSQRVVAQGCAPGRWPSVATGRWPSIIALA